jgi:hypothetical protein
MRLLARVLRGNGGGEFGISLRQAGSVGVHEVVRSKG